MSRKGHLYCLLAALFTAFFILVSCINDEHDETKGLSVGETIPGFSVKACICDKNDWRYESYGESFEINTNAFSGKMGIIAFFNTDCEDCRKELPEIQKIYDKIKDNSNYQLVCIAREETEADINKYWSENDLTLPYSAQSDRQIYNLFAKTIIPRIYIINMQGIITNIHTDSPLVSSEQLIEEIK